MCDRRNTVSFGLKHGILRQLNVKGKEKEMFLPYLSILFQANAWKTLSWPRTLSLIAFPTYLWPPTYNFKVLFFLEPWSSSITPDFFSLLPPLTKATFPLPLSMSETSLHFKEMTQCVTSSLLVTNASEQSCSPLSVRVARTEKPLCRRTDSLLFLLPTGPLNLSEQEISRD